MSRRALTADDILRGHDEPDRKRRRLSPHADLLDSYEVTGKSTSDLSSDEEDLSDKESSDDGSHSSQRTFLPSRIQTTREGHTNRPPEPLQSSSSKVDAAHSFVSLGVSLSLSTALKSMSILKPTPVQVGCIPPLLAGLFRPTFFTSRELIFSRP